MRRWTTFAIVDKRQGDQHHRSRSALARLRLPLVTTWACFTEAMYLVGKSGGRPLQNQLWGLVETTQLLIAVPDDPLIYKELMDRFADVPMDLADATLMVLAESLHTQEIFTLDSDFYGYRFSNGKAPIVVPEKTL